MLLIFSICSGRELLIAIPLLSLLRRISSIHGGKGLRWGFGIFGVLVMEIGSSYKINNKTWFALKVFFSKYNYNQLMSNQPWLLIIWWYDRIIGERINIQYEPSSNHWCSCNRMRRRFGRTQVGGRIIDVFLQDLVFSQFQSISPSAFSFSLSSRRWICCPYSQRHLKYYETYMWRD